MKKILICLALVLSLVLVVGTSPSHGKEKVPIESVFSQSTTLVEKQVVYTANLEKVANVVVDNQIAKSGYSQFLDQPKDVGWQGSTANYTTKSKTIAAEIFLNYRYHNKSEEAESIRYIERNI